MQNRRQARLVDLSIMAILTLFALVVYVGGIESTAFHQDESRWLNRAHYLTDLLDPFGPTWNDQYLTRGQPPIGSYMMGAGLLLQGRDLDTNPAYDFRRSREVNQELGTIPDHDDLVAGRRWNSLLGAVAVAGVYLAARQLTNPAGGIVGALFLIANPLQSWHNRLALADTTLTLTLALLVLCVIRLMRRPSWGWAIATGVLIGIGGANKFTPIALSIPLAAIGGLMLLHGWLDRRKLRTSTPSSLLALPSFRDHGWKLVSTPITALATFVIVYPYLWPDPIGRTLTLIRFRQDEMTNQYRLYPQFRADNPVEALEKTINALGRSWSSTAEFLAQIGMTTLGKDLSLLDLVLASVGLIMLAAVGIRKGLRSAELAVTAIIVFQTVTIILSMRVDFERYYLPILLGEVIAVGCSVGYATGWLWRRMARRPAHAT
ncbi:MAG TPA: glycosyltransferase family 39 protein [Thermomicrobiales bacterium]|nr:glycosyltransferase family 39 protein [Thermomicrobiales bacterium]